MLASRGGLRENRRSCSAGRLGNQACGTYLEWVQQCNQMNHSSLIIKSVPDRLFAWTGPVLRYIRQREPLVDEDDGRGLPDGCKW